MDELERLDAKQLPCREHYERRGPKTAEEWWPRRPFRWESNRDVASSYAVCLSEPGLPNK